MVKPSGTITVLVIVTSAVSRVFVIVDPLATGFVVDAV